MADNIWKEKGNNYSFLWYEVKIIDREENSRIRRLKKAVYIVGHNYLLSRPSIEMNTI